MSLPLVFRAAAQAEFDDAAAWYERQRPGLGGNFVVEARCSNETGRSVKETGAD
jgi:hypothetical protein